MTHSEEKVVLRFLLNVFQNKKVQKAFASKLVEWWSANSTVFLFGENDETEAPLVLESEERPKQHQQVMEYAVRVMSTRQRKLLRKCKGTFENTLELTAKLFGLSPTETTVLSHMICMQRCYMMEDLADELTSFGARRRISRKLDPVNFTAIATGLTSSDIDKALHQGGKLLGCGLVQTAHSIDWFGPSQNILRAFKVSEKYGTADELAALLIGDPQRMELTWEDFSHVGKDREMLEKLLVAAIDQQEPGINILFYGKPGTGKTEFCRTLAAKVGIPLYAIAEVDEEDDEPDRSHRMQSLRLLQTILGNTKNSAIMVDEAEDVFGYETGGGPWGGNVSENSRVKSKVYMNRQLETNPVPVFWLTNNPQGIDKAFIRRMSYCLEFADLPFAVRLQMSKKECNRQALGIDETAIRKLTVEYNATPATFANAAKVTRLVEGRLDELRHVIQSQNRLLGAERVAEPTVEGYSVSLLNTDVNLFALTESILQRGRTDCSFCLYGPPGSGKSEFARWFADGMGMEVLHKRASELISKWVGGTEQNIAAAFQDAKSQNRILVFDEADSFLYSRKDARNSWEVSHVNEMLTWMERHPLPFICTTNLMERLDEAALRRFTFKVRFDFMRREQIEAAFQKFFELKAPRNVLSMECLTPGDFAVVKKKVAYFGETSAEEIGRLLAQETLLKSARAGAQQIGFLAG